MLDFRDSTLTYAQESIFSPTNHSAIVRDSTSVTIFHVTDKKYRLVSSGNGQLSTRTRVIVLWAQPVVGLWPTTKPGIKLHSKPLPVPTCHKITSHCSQMSSVQKLV